MKRALLSFVISLVLTGLVLWITQMPGKHWVNNLTVLSFVVGSYVSGNLHQPDIVVGLMVLFSIIFAITHTCVYLITTIMNRMHTGEIAWPKLGGGETGQTVPGRPVHVSKKDGRRK